MSTNTYYLRYSSVAEMLPVLYATLQDKRLYDPEFTLFQKDPQTGKIGMSVFSREGASNGQPLPTEARFKTMMKSPYVAAVMFVTSSDAEDSRRMSIAYCPQPKAQPSLLVNLVIGDSPMNETEKSVLAALEEKAVAPAEPTAYEDLFSLIDL